MYFYLQLYFFLLDKKDLLAVSLYNAYSEDNIPL